MDEFRNIIWRCMAGSQRHLTAGSDVARRYLKGFSPIIAFADTQRPDFAALEPYCETGEHFYTSGWTGAAPRGWQVDAEQALLKMVWEGARPAVDPDFAVRPLAVEHVPQMLELVALTKPGPFGPRTIELGDYVGCFEGPRLVAMAGERMHAGRLREISGVCTHPGFQGRGLARRLMEVLLRRELQRGELPFLHVMKANAGAQRVYERMGFRTHLEEIVRVLSRSG